MRFYTVLTTIHHYLSSTLKTLATRLFIVGVFLFLVALSPRLAWSQQDEKLEIRTNRAWADFPDEITFNLTVNASSPIDSIKLEYGVDKTSCEQSAGRAVPDVSEVEQGGLVVATWTWELYRSGSLAPGARVWWVWHVTTEDGATLTTDQKWITFEDYGYGWRRVQEGQISVHWYEGDRAFGLGMLQTAVQAQARLTADPGANLEKPIHIYFYANSDDLKDALIFPQDWTGGIAFTDFYTVLIAAGPQNLEYGQRTVTHELMHLVVHQLAFNCWSDIPRWLDEGLASWAEQDLEPSQQELLAEAISDDTLLSLPGLNSAFSAHADRAYLSYAQSYSVVSFLIDEYGREKVLELLAVFREGATYDGALEQVYGLDTLGLEDLWRASIGAQPRPTASAPRASATPAPTLSLWSAEPTASSVTATATTAPTPQPSATSTLEPTRAVAVVSPTARATRVSSAPQLIVGTDQPKDAGGQTNYIIVASVGGLALLVLALLALYARRRPK